VITDIGRYRLAVPPEACDDVVFEHAAATGERLLASGRPEQAVAELDRALALWRGEVLADLADYEFVAPVAASLRERRLATLQARVDARMALGQDAAAVRDLDELVAQYPLREELHQRRMLALYPPAGNRTRFLPTTSSAASSLTNSASIPVPRSSSCTSRFWPKTQQLPPPHHR
jgi:DNA-binding SARP family transcriptional activator